MTFIVNRNVPDSVLQLPSLFCNGDCMKWTRNYNENGECNICGGECLSEGAGEHPYDLYYTGDPIEE